METIRNLVRMDYITKTEINEVLNADTEYVAIQFCVTNTGFCVKLEATDNFDYIDEDTWNGYDYILDMDAFMEELETAGGVFDVDGELCFIPEIL